MNIFVDVINQSLKISTIEKTLVDGTQEFIKMTFNLSEDWNELLTFAQFEQDGHAYNQYLDEENSVYLPSEIKKGVCTVLLYGSNKNVIAITNQLVLNIINNHLIADAQSTVISTSLYNQLVTKFTTLNTKVESIEQNATDDKTIIENVLNELQKTNSNASAFDPLFDPTIGTKNNFYNVKDYYASMGNYTDATQKAIDTCRDNGGGIIYFPEGEYDITRTIFFYSNQVIFLHPKAVLKRTKANSTDTLAPGCFFCNWFEPNDTKSGNTFYRTANVRIIGGTFDMGGFSEITNNKSAPINLCHAANIYVYGVTFINNAEAHCIEINSSKNVYVDSCVFKDYKTNTYKSQYNEMIQIDKAINSSLGGAYGYSSSFTSTLAGYKTTRTTSSGGSTSANMLVGTFGKATQIYPDDRYADYQPCSNIHIYNCDFTANQFCCAIGNHHEIIATNSKLHDGIFVYNNTFRMENVNGTPASGHKQRAFISLDWHTKNVSIYKNMFLGNKVAEFHPYYADNRYSSTQNINVYYNHFIDGASVTDNRIQKHDNVNPNGISYITSPINPPDAPTDTPPETLNGLTTTKLIGGFQLNTDEFNWALTDEYDNEDIYYNNAGFISLNAVVNPSKSLATGWHDLGTIKDPNLIPVGTSPVLLTSTSSNSSVETYAVIIPKGHKSTADVGKIRVRFLGSALNTGHFIYVGGAAPIGVATGKLPEGTTVSTKYQSAITLNSNEFNWALVGEYDNENIYYHTVGFLSLNAAVAPKATIKSGWYVLGTINNPNLIPRGTSPIILTTTSSNGSLETYGVIIPKDYKDSNLIGQIRVRISGDLSAGAFIYAGGLASMGIAT